MRAILPGGQDFVLTDLSRSEAVAEDDSFLPAIGKLVAAEITKA